jgi:hypothetical protein
MSSPSSLTPSAMLLSNRSSAPVALVLTGAKLVLVQIVFFQELRANIASAEAHMAEHRPYNEFDMAGITELVTRYKAAGLDADELASMVQSISQVRLLRVARIALPEPPLSLSDRRALYRPGGVAAHGVGRPESPFSRQLSTD